MSQGRPASLGIDVALLCEEKLAPSFIKTVSAGSETSTGNEIESSNSPGNRFRLVMLTVAVVLLWL